MGTKKEYRVTIRGHYGVDMHEYGHNIVEIKELRELVKKYPPRDCYSHNDEMTDDVYRVEELDGGKVYTGKQILELVSEPMGTTEKDLKKEIEKNQDIRENIKEIVLGNLEMGSVGSLDFDADHIADDLMPYVIKTILEERKKTLEEVKGLVYEYDFSDYCGNGKTDIRTMIDIEDLSKLLKEENEKDN